MAGWPVAHRQGLPNGGRAGGRSLLGSPFPVGSYVSAYTSTTAYTITFPTQAVAPTLSGTFTASATCTVTYPTQASAPSLSTGTYKAYNDVYDIVTNQNYIFDFKIHTDEDYDIDLNVWRDFIKIPTHNYTKFYNWKNIFR